jgi:hypothetical protein
VWLQDLLLHPAVGHGGHRCDAAGPTAPARLSGCEQLLTPLNGTVEVVLIVFTGSPNLAVCLHPFQQDSAGAVNCSGEVVDSSAATESLPAVRLGWVLQGQLGCDWGFNSSFTVRAVAGGLGMRLCPAIPQVTAVVILLID